MPKNFDKKIIEKNFSKAATAYDVAAEIQKIAAEKFCDLVVTENLFKDAKSERVRILDLGSGTSFIAKNLLQKLAPETVENFDFFELDLSHKMLQQWRDRPKKFHAIQADFEFLPFKKNSFNIVVSSFSLQWSNDLASTFFAVKKLLKNDGIFACCLPLNESLAELKIASRDSKCNFDFTTLPVVDSLNSIIEKSGFSKVFVGTELVKQNFKNGLSAIKSLKKIGASYLDKNRKNRPLTKKKIQSFNQICSDKSPSQNFLISWHLFSFAVKKIVKK